MCEANGNTTLNMKNGARCVVGMCREGGNRKEEEKNEEDKEYI